LILWTFTLIINWFIPSVPDEKGYDFSKGIDLGYFSGFLGYFVLGFYLSRIDVLNSLKGNCYSLFFIVLGLIVTYAGTYYSSIQVGHFSRDFVRYLTPNVALVSIGLFLLFKNNLNRVIKNKYIRFGVEAINKYSYGIYLSHFFFLWMLSRIGVDKYYINPLVGIFLTTIICLILSLSITVVINKLPFGRKFSG
jgi:surface polysaccharide O-acyltransferase-like enzyme